VLRTGVQEQSAPEPIAQAETPTQTETPNFRFAALPLRAALKEMGGDRTGSIQQAAPASVTLAPSAPLRERSVRFERRAKSATTQSPEPRASGKTPARSAQTATPANPLTVVKLTASAMAERFATDLRALPSQISAIFNR
jgi:hypothetical protein